MQVVARKHLWRDVDAVFSSDIKLQVVEFIEEARQCTLAELLRRYDFSPLKTDPAFYRLRIDKYRLGCRYDRVNDTLLLMRLLHREIIYDYFP
jgi:mRNA-degrading endonuclease RelE of RelBE toxin-antitoxin system